METWQEHRKILRALARRASGAAQKAMHEHVRNAALRTGIAFVAPPWRDLGYTQTHVTP
jgi:GntR family transcriptional repressor for pyruvate dehydrogenase complex